MSRSRVLVGLVVLGLLAVVFAVVLHGPGTTRLTVEFSSGQGLHPGDEVRVLGVRVGRIDAVVPRGDHVEVTLSVEGGQRVPVGAGAVVVSPNLVGGSYVQLAPAYEGGPVLADGGRIGLERTAVPVRWDQVKTELTELTQALGPRSGQDAGPLANALTGTARALRGNGAALASSVTEASRAAEVLAAGSADFYTTVRNLGTFMQAMNASDADVLSFARELASVSDVLAENRSRLERLLVQVAGVVKDLRGFIRRNRSVLTASIAKATTLVSDLQDLQVDLANILHLAPTTLANFYNIYDPSTGAFTGRPALAHSAGLSNLACQAIYSAGGTLTDCQKALGAVLDQLPLGELPFTVGGLQQGGASNQQSGNGGTP